MDPLLIMQLLIAAVAGTLIYTVIGIAPGTDETAVLAPVTLVLVLTGLAPIIILTFFISAIVAKKLTDSIPVAVAGIPGGVMAAPMVEHALVLKKHNRADLAIRKMASGSVIGTLVSVPLSLLLAQQLLPFADVVKTYANPLFFFGAIFLALMSKERFVSLLAILPFALLIQGLRELYWATGVVPEGQTVFTSFFLGITIGPVLLTLFELFNTDKRTTIKKHQTKEVKLRYQQHIETLHPFKILSKEELTWSTLSSVFGSILFILSPVGITILLGEVISSRVKDPVRKASLAISSMDALTNAAYIAGTLIPLIALGVPLSPVAIGPGGALFNAPPVFNETYNMHHALSMPEFIIATLIGATVAIVITYFIIVKYAEAICYVVFKHVPHEALLALFIGLVVLLSFMDGGLLNVFGVGLVAIVAGYFHRLGMNYGVQFMVLYAAPWLIGLF